MISLEFKRFNKKKKAICQQRTNQIMTNDIKPICKNKNIKTQDWKSLLTQVHPLRKGVPREVELGLELPRGVLDPKRWVPEDVSVDTVFCLALNIVGNPSFKLMFSQTYFSLALMV